MASQLAALSLSLSVLAGCVAASETPEAPKDDDASLLTIARRSSALFGQTAGLAVIAVDPLASGVADENEAAARSIAAAGDYFDDVGCLGASLDPQRPNVVVLTFDDCDGPYGLENITGELAITFAREGAGLSVTLASVGALQVDDAALQFSASVAVPDLTNPRSVTVQSTSQLVIDDLVLGYAGAFTLAWDAGLCFTLSADLAITAGERVFTVAIDALQRCPGECPDGSIKLGSGTPGADDERTIEVVFDGDHTAKLIVTTPDGTHSIPFPILCS